MFIRTYINVYLFTHTHPYIPTHYAHTQALQLEAAAILNNLFAASGNAPPVRTGAGGGVVARGGRAGNRQSVDDYTHADYVLYDSFECLTGLMHMCDVTRSHL